MPEQDPMDRFESRLTDLLRVYTGVAVRPLDAGAMTSLAMAAPARSRWSRRTRTLDRRLAWALVALAALIALVGALVFGGSERRTTDFVSVLPAELPADIAHGIIDTPIGPARWVHLTGDPTTMPDPLFPTIGPAGLIWFETSRPRLLTSEDALSTRIEQPLPIDAAFAELHRDGETYWLVTAEPASLWRSQDVRAWERVDVSGLVSPWTTVDLQWDLRLGAPVTSDGVTLVSLTFVPRDLGRLVGHPGLTVRLEAADPGRYRVLEHLDPGLRVIGFVQVEETPSGLRFTDDGGATIAELRGADLGFMDAWVQGVTEEQLGIIDGGRLSAVEPPWDGWPTLFPVDSGFLAFQVGADRTVSTLRTEDGRSWEPGATLSDEEGRPLRAAAVLVESIDDRAQVRVVRSGSDGWTSSDGAHWTHMAASPSQDSVLLRLHAGWLVSQRGSWSVSRDGATWQEVPELREVIDKWEPSGAGGSSVGLVDDALFFSVQEDEGTQQRDLWIVEFEAP